MTRTAPLRWITLHFSHIGLTDARTFIAPVSSRIQDPRTSHESDGRVRRGPLGRRRKIAGTESPARAPRGDRRGRIGPMPRRPAQDTYTAVDAFVEATLFAAPAAARDDAATAAATAGMPEIQVTAPQARLLEILCRAVNARRILEFGTLGGYST